ncbi:glutamate synthase subunit beta [Actinokineospora bangkokensis]|uniref:Glutamate synthase n=1 Tax=Actinokineospora bangkokensis TaxID=1193682 RepID=A0A1Q9LQJ0_9PSEU|nr:glutamate synthase subunit beta [Actinokineospora bangkokensis]OLR94306.1 glutamate synthase [Actinokineospora bangkokensis]
MADPKGFLTTRRETPTSRPVFLRLQDWREVYAQESVAEFTAGGKGAEQAGRCMDCGIPFCHNGCPLGNLIPEWNTLVWRQDWKVASERLHATNNFPEFTGTLCPAPCEAACVLGINDDPVTIKRVEISIVDRAWDEGWVTPQPPATRTGKRVAVVGSGPAGLAAAQQLTRAGHDVVVYERADAVGGLLRYGIPEFKMEKFRLDRRLAQMRAEGTEFTTGVDIGVDITAEQLRADHDAVVLAGGATQWRDLPIPGRELGGVHQAMEFLPLANRVAAGSLAEPAISAAGKHVVVIGGGDTGADCVGTSHRQGAASVTQLEIMPRPADARTDAFPWPTYPMLYRVSSAHEEGGERVYAVSTTEFLGDEHGNVRALRLAEVENVDGRFTPVPGSEREIPAQLVTLAMGFTGPEKGALLTDLGVDLDQRGNVARGPDYQTTVPGVFTAGDMGRGQSLIVWAIAEGRSAAAGVDAYLTGRTVLPRPIDPTDRPLT